MHSNNRKERVVQVQQIHEHLDYSQTKTTKRIPEQQKKNEERKKERKNSGAR
jgi:hypothetical protein